MNEAKPTKPDLLFEIWTPDTVAECLVGGSDPALYEKLWGMVEDYPDKRSPEEMETPDAEQSNNLAQFWGRLTREQQTLLNELAEKADEISR